MKAYFIDRKGFSAYFDVPSPPPREWRIAVPIHFGRFFLGTAEELNQALPSTYDRDVVDFELYGYENALPVYREKI